MPTEVKDDEMPDAQYVKVKAHDHLAMMTIAPNGLIFMYPDLGQNRFATWEELAELVATATLKEPEEPVPSGKPREIKGPSKPAK